jgi:FlaA1/EpsC-like NDP-sugar epimerase
VAQLIRRHHRAGAVLLYAAITSLAYLLAFHITFGFTIPVPQAHVMASTMLLLIVVRVTSFASFRLDRTTWRFASTGDVLRLAGCTLLGMMAFLVFSEAGTLRAQIPRVVILLEAGLTANLTAAVWIFYRAGYEYQRTHAQGNGHKRVLIVGAGEAGHLLARVIQRSGLGYRLLGFIDDDPEKLHTEVFGTAVLGSTAELGEIARRTRADELLIAGTTPDQKPLRNTVAAGDQAGLRIKVLPAFEELVRGDGLLGRPQEVRAEDLLGRDPVQLELPELAADLHGRVVFISGGAGSIGSELARQIARHRPEALLLFDHAETQLFYTELELREHHPDLRIVPVLGDITDTPALERVFREYRPQRVFHAAAYKHVPMMEANVRAAIRTNVIATRSLAALSGMYAAEKFVLMSTDKAVCPCGVMGATKRLAELAVLELQDVFPATAFCGVRFGNVLGSNGSVLPIFARQIEAGQPLTVTHPEMTRYFMTIPEAVQLILQASLLRGIQGQLAMLEMGDPVRIMELAQKFLQLSGRGSTHGIVFTGLRPGERLHEELIAPNEETLPTAIPKVRIVLTPRLNNGEIGRLVERFEHLLREGNESAALLHLKRQFPDLRLAIPARADENEQGAGRRARAETPTLIFPLRPDAS